MKYIIQHIRNEETINILKELINNKYITNTTIETIYHGYEHINKDTLLDKQILITTTYTQDKITTQKIEDCFKGIINHTETFDIIENYTYIQNHARFQFDGCLSIKFETENDIQDIIDNFETRTATELFKEYIHDMKIGILKPLYNTKNSIRHIHQMIPKT